MTRRLLNLLTVLSLLMCVAVALAVAHSYWTEHYFRRARRAVEGTALTESEWTARVAWGAVAIERESAVTTYPSAEGPEYVVRAIGGGVRFSHESGRAVAPREEFGSLWDRVGFSGHDRFITYPASNFTEAGPRRPTGRSLRQTAIAFPIWPLGLACVVPPVLSISRLSRRVRSGRKARHGLCPACGYDLRATPGRCPECGEASRQGPHAEAAGKGPV